MRVCNSRASGRTMDLWLALWALGAGGIVGSERVRVRGHGAEGVGGGTAAGLGLGESPQAH